MEGQPVGKRLEDQRRVEARHRGAADVLAHIDRRHAERRRLANHVDRKVLLLVPFERVRRNLVVGESARHVADRDVVGIERKVGSLRITACDVGRTQRLPYCTATRPTRSRATISFMIPAVPSPISRPITSRMRC